MHITPSASRAAALVILVVIFLVGTPPTPVGACVPAATPASGATRPPPTVTPTIAQAAAQAEVVFRGHPIRHEDASYKFIDAPAFRTTFAVETLWKGPATPEITVLTFDCGPNANPFATDGTYIVYASKGPNGELVPLTGVSRPASASDQEDAVLGPGAIPPTGVSGAPPPTASAVTPVLSPSTGTATGSVGDGTRRGQGSRVPILLIAAAIVAIGGLIVAVMRGRTRPG